MSSVFKKTLCAAGATLSLSAQAAGVIDIFESGADVMATASGTFDVTSLVLDGASNSSKINPTFFFGPMAIIGGTNNQEMDAFVGMSAAPAIGTGGSTAATSSAGDRIGFAGNSFSGNSVLYLPDGYVSGSFVSGTSSWVNASLASLGLAVGTYTWTWGAGPTADSLTLNITAAAPVPEPESALMMLAGLAAAAVAARRRRSA